MTGASIPNVADTLVQFEHTEEDILRLTPLSCNITVILRLTLKGRNVRKAGKYANKRERIFQIKKARVLDTACGTSNAIADSEESNEYKWWYDLFSGAQGKINLSGCFIIITALCLTAAGEAGKLFN